MTHTEFKSWFPQELKRRREANGLTQEQLGLLVIGKPPVQAQISAYETGQKLPNGWRFYKLQEQLGSFVE